MNVKRICIYYFSDPDGIADGCTEAYLSGLKPHVDRFAIVSGGPLTEDSRALFRRFTEDVLELEEPVREIWAYRTAMKNLGWSTLESFDEVILTSSALLGPVRPFAEMFEAMDAQEKPDFWGITTVGEQDTDRKEFKTYGCIPEHISFHFIVFRRRFLKQQSLRDYFDRMPEPADRDEPVGHLEACFTRLFSCRGFHWAVYVPTPGGSAYTSDYLIMAPVQALRESRCPVFDRASFSTPQIRYIRESLGEQPWELFRYLKTETDYDTETLLDDLIRTGYQDDIARTLRLTYVLPSEEALCEGKTELRVATVMHLYFMDLLPDSVHYAASLPPEADIYITTSKEENVEPIREAFSVLPNRVEVRIIENRGRDVSSLLIGAADLQEKYDLICFFHDKKTLQLKPQMVGRGFAYTVSESVLSTPAYVRNVIRCFENDPRLGILSPNIPNHADFLYVLCFQWGYNFNNVKALTEELGMHVPLSDRHPPVAPLGTIFWYRTAALRPLFARTWHYEDFPPEPNENDGTLLHALERSYALAAQAAGYYAGRVAPDHLASLELDNLRFYVAEYSRVSMDNGIWGGFSDILATESSRLQPRMSEMFRKSTRHRLFIVRATLFLLARTRLFLKGCLSKEAYVKILRLKRSIFGPHIPVEED